MSLLGSHTQHNRDMIYNIQVKEHHIEKAIALTRLSEKVVNGEMRIVRIVNPYECPIALATEEVLGRSSVYPDNGEYNLQVGTERADLPLMAREFAAKFDRIMDECIENDPMERIKELYLFSFDLNLLHL